MEDSHAVYHDEVRGFMSAEVYDGHGGRDAALYASEMLTPSFLHNWAQDMEKPRNEQKPLYEHVREAYSAVDRYIITRTGSIGTTAATLFIIDDRFIAANAGDTRIVMGTAGGATVLTRDHRATEEDEVMRVIELGGSIVQYGVPRVEGVLAVTRSLGDGMFKPYVTAEPRIVLGKFGSENDFAIVACDGVWDVLEPETAMKTIRSAGSVQSAADLIVSKALEQGSTDNMTVMVLDLRQHCRKIDHKKTIIMKVIDHAIHDR